MLYIWQVVDTHVFLRLILDTHVLFDIFHGQADTLARQRVHRQRMRLLVGQHLQAVFQLPQIAVGVAQGLGFLGAQISLAREQGEHLEQAAAAQLGLAAAANQLQGLHDELDFADAARAQLDIVAHTLARHLRCNHRLHLADFGQHGIIKIAAINKGLQDGL